MVFTVTDALAEGRELMDGLYRTSRTYFDSGSDEFKNHPIKEKLLDIGYATWFGHNIKKDVNHIIRRYPHVSNRDIRRAIWMMMAELSHTDDFNVFDRRNTIDTDIDVFLEDLMRVFRLPEGDRRKAYIGSGPRSIEFSELKAMNGWNEVADQRPPSKMYTVGNWIMFPGDGEIIRRFNLDGSTADRCYPSYVYPEPWYGSPVRAKVIVLGNEARYDDFVSRIQNLVLQQVPMAYIESFEVNVREWHELGVASSMITATEGSMILDLLNIFSRSSRRWTYIIHPPTGFGLRSSGSWRR